MSKQRFVRNLPIVAGSILILSLLPMSAIGALFVHNSIHAAADLRFDNYINETQISIEERMTLYIHALTGIKALFGSSDSVERDEFHDYLDSIDLTNELPYITGITFSHKVKASEVQDFVASVRNDRSMVSGGFPNFTITPTDTGKDTFYVMNFIYPFNPSSTSMGLDLSTNTERFPSIREAEDTGEPSMTDRITLLGTNPRPGIAIYFPVYKNNTSIETVEDRRNNLLGALGGIFSTQDLFKNITPITGTKFEIFAGGDLSEDNLLYSSTGSLSTVAELETAYTSETIDLPILNRNWSVRFTALPEFSNSTVTRVVPLIVLFGGGSISILAMIILYSLSTSTKRAQIIADKITNELAKSDAYQKAILNGTDYSIIATDPKGVIQLFNKSAEKLLEYRAEEVVGKQSVTMVHEKFEIASYAEELSSEIGKAVSPDFEVFTINPIRGLPESREWTYVRKNKTTFPVDLSVTAIRDTNGELLGYLGIAKDITQVKQERENLTKKTKELEEINALMVNRELKMIEMKKKLTNLEKKV